MTGRFSLVGEDPEVRSEWDADRAVAERAAWRAVVGERFVDAAKSDIPPDWLAAIAPWTSIRKDHRPNLVLLGPVGVGKTHLGTALVREMWHAGMSVVFRPEDEMLERMRPGRSGEAGELRTVVDADVLLLDDVGMVRASDWTDQQGYSVINRRWIDCKPIIATTNLAPADLRSAVGERVFSRLVGSGAVVVTLKGRDRRSRP